MHHDGDSSFELAAELEGTGKLTPQVAQVRSGQVYYSAKVEDHESHKAAYATSSTSEHRLLISTSSYARIVT